MDVLAVVTALTGPALRGDVLPACMWLDGAKHDGDWQTRAEVAWSIGPMVPPPVLDRLCELMPDACEPRLLRAAALMRRGGAREVVLRDLAIAARVAPADPIPRAWSVAARAPAQ